MSSTSSADPSPSPLNSSGNPSTKHAWSQIVAASASKKLTQVAESEQIPTIVKEPVTNLVRGQTPANAELVVSPHESTLDDDRAGVEDARACDETSVKGVEAPETSKNVSNSNAGGADGTEASQNKSTEGSSGDGTEPRAARPPWRKPPTLEGDIKVQPVMGATAWPALEEARNMKKNSEMRNLRVSSPTTLQSEPASTFQGPPSKSSLQSGDGSIHQQGVKHKPSFKGNAGGIGRPAFQPIENGSSFVQHPAMSAHGGSEQSIRHNPHARMKGNFAGNPIDNDRGHHHRNDVGGPFPSNNRKWRNNHRDQRGWNQHGRAFENVGDMATLLHEQRIGPRNMPRPQPYINMNAGFYPMPHFQNGMYYLPPGGPEFMNGPPYYPPMVPPVVPDPLVLRSLLLKQVDYYFSVENLCRDIFLRKHMDEEGFVPISLIAQFNRIRNLSTNPMLILEALQQSAVVEVQHDRIRRRNDRGKWRLVRDQEYAGNSMQEKAPHGNLSEKVHREPEQGIESGLVVPMEEVNNGLAKASDMPRGAHREAERVVVGLQKVYSSLTEASDMPVQAAEHLPFSSDRVKDGTGDCVGLEDKSEHQAVADIDWSKDQHSALSSADACAATQSSLSRDGSTVEAAVNCLCVNDSAGCQSADLNLLQGGPDCSCRSPVASNQESCSSDGRFSKESSTAPQASTDRRSESWKASEGFWMESSAYLMHGCFEQDGAETTDSDFVLKIHEDGGEHLGEVNDRELDRLINVSRTPLGSYIAVP